ncbi:MAG: DNA-binding protein, excisionase family [Firmicutes bacterium]|nr:DNA-binding protein, excisionase family [Bacillota bacterium]
MTRRQIDKPMAVTIETAGQLLGISRSLSYQMAKEGKLPTIKLGERRLLVPMVGLEKLLSGKEG